MKDISLRDYQESGAQNMSEYQRGILAFPTGQGKCTTSIRAFELLDLHHMVVVAPTNALSSWVGDLQSFWEGSYVYFNGKDVDLSRFFLKASGDHRFVLVVPQSRLTQLLDSYARDFGATKYLLVVDEVDDITNYKTVLFQNLLHLSRNASCCYGLSGSPIHAKLEKTYAYLNLVFPYGNPYGFWGDFKSTFLKTAERRTRTHSFEEVVGYLNVDRFREIFESICVRVVSKAQVDFRFIDVELSTGEMSSYVNAAYEAFTSGAAASRLHELQLHADGSLMSNPLNTTKMTALVRLLSDTLHKRGNPVIIYVEYHQTREAVAQRLHYLGVDFRSIIGGMSTEQRQEVLDWAKKGGFRVVLMTRAGIRGANLQMCESTICFDTPFDVKNLIQLLGRQSRIGSPFERNYVFFICALGTIDEYKSANVRQSSDLILEVLRGSATLPESTDTLTREDVVKMRKTILWRMRR